MTGGLILHHVDTGTGMQDIAITGGTIRSLAATTGDQQVLHLHFGEAIAFPGLINSHDHLDFNNFPMLGNRIYEDYVAWGADIHLRNKDTIQAVLKIPQQLRIRWGLYKNLLNGITTVVQHGALPPIANDLIYVFQDCVSIHSVRQERRWQYLLNKPRLSRLPVVVHTGEGTNAAAAAEIDRLLRWNIRKQKLIGIHGVAMNARQARGFEALIWCPDSNDFLLGRTADIALLRQSVPILFGTDSTVSSRWNLWAQLRSARATGMLPDEELFRSLTSTPAAIWGLHDRGALRAGAAADLVIARKKEPGFQDSFYALNPEDLLLVVRGGTIVLYDASLREQLSRNEAPLQQNSGVWVNGALKWVNGDLPALMQAIRRHYPAIVFPDVAPA